MRRIPVVLWAALFAACSGGDSDSLNDDGGAGSGTDAGNATGSDAGKERPDGGLDAGRPMRMDAMVAPDDTGVANASDSHVGTMDAAITDAGGQQKDQDAADSDAGTDGGLGTLVTLDDGGVSCVFGTALGQSKNGDLNTAAISYFANGASLPAGDYRVSYVDGCMKYASTQDWTVHAYADGSIGWYLGQNSGDQLLFLPGTAGYSVATGAYTDFEACVTANKMVAPITFSFAGGPLGVWVLDSKYLDNENGLDGRDPTWNLERLGGCP